MERNIGNVMFALFAVMLSMGAVFADANGTIAANSPPVITGVGGPTSINAGETGTWTVSAYDPDGNYISNSVSWGDNLGQAQQGQTESGSTATFQHTYSSAGTYTITFTVHDSAGASTQSSITTTVTGTAPSDQPPTIATFTGPSTISPGEIGFWSLKVNDADDSYARYTIQWGDGSSTPSARLACGITYDRSFSHAYSSSGTYTVTLSVTDEHGSATATQATASVVVTSKNKAPVITEVNSPASLAVNEQGTWYIAAYDPDGAYLSYSVVWGDEGTGPVSGDAMLRTGSSASFQHTYSKAGTYNVIFSVMDSAGASTQSTTYVSVGGATGGSADLYVSTSVIEPTNTLDSQGKRLVNWKAYVQNVGTETSGKYMLNSYIDDALVPSQQEMTYGGLAAGKWYITPYYSSYIPAGSHQLKLVITPLGPDANPSNNEYTQKFDVNGASTNLPPVINEMAGPAEIAAGKSGTWKIGAYDPDGKYLYYSVNWGESSKTPSASDSPSSTATFQHTYAQAGTYTITFTVLDDQMAKTESTLSVKVTGSGTGTEGVTAAVGAVPTEVYQYDTVYVTGKISRGTDASSESAQTYKVVLSLDNGNDIAKTVSVEGTVSSTSVASSGQAREEEITLYPGESREVSAYFTASKLGTNFAKIMVYQKGSDRCKSTDYDTGASGQATRCSNYYTLVASDSTKVYVKESGIPSPPSEGVTIVLAKGWNQISVPAKRLEVSELAEKCDISENVWYYNSASKQYEKVSYLGAGSIGYWVKANADCKYTIDSPYLAPASDGAFNLKAGWNMIGAPLSATAISNMAGDCKITSGPWNYSPAASQYTYSEKLEPGKGYWVKVASACTLGSGNDMPPSAPDETQAVRAVASN